MKNKEKIEPTPTAYVDEPFIEWLKARMTLNDYQWDYVEFALKEYASKKTASLEDQLKAADQLSINLKCVWERAIEAKGACYISSMERGEIETALEKYKSLKGK